MEAQTDIQTYMEQGKQALAQGQGRESAIAYAHAAQIEPNNPLVHLGLAEANLALASYGVVYMACRKVQELQKEGFAYLMAQALLDLLDRRYERALQDVDAAIKEDPSNGYAHALRSYVLRVLGQSYDAGLARARASRLSYGGTYENCFPPIEQTYNAAAPLNGDKLTQDQAQNANPLVQDAGGAGREQVQVPPWSRPNAMQRQTIRTRFWMSQNPRFVTNLLIMINVTVYVITALVSAAAGGGLTSFLDINPNVLLAFGGQYNALVAQGQVWRIFTAMFLHLNIFHIGLNMLSLFLIGPAIEVFYGKWRYLLIYLLSGIAGGIVSFFVMGPDFFAVGASGAIFGIFGALGTFYIANRRALGAYGTGAITNWVFWLGLNLVYGFANAGSIGIVDHLGGLVAGLLLGIVLLPRLRRRTS